MGEVCSRDAATAIHQLELRQFVAAAIDYCRRYRAKQMAPPSLISLPPPSRRSSLLMPD